MRADRRVRGRETGRGRARRRRPSEVSTGTRPPKRRLLPRRRTLAFEHACEMGARDRTGPGMMPAACAPTTDRSMTPGWMRRPRWTTRRDPIIAASKTRGTTPASLRCRKSPCCRGRAAGRSMDVESPEPQSRRAASTNFALDRRRPITERNGSPSERRRGPRPRSQPAPRRGGLDGATDRPSGSRCSCTPSGTPRRLRSPPPRSPAVSEPEQRPPRAVSPHAPSRHRVRPRSPHGGRDAPGPPPRSAPPLDPQGTRRPSGQGPPRETTRSPPGGAGALGRARVPVRRHPAWIGLWRHDRLSPARRPARTLSRSRARPARRRAPRRRGPARAAGRG